MANNLEVEMKIAIIGLGYVGTANGILLSKAHDIMAYDKDEEKVKKVNEGNIVLNGQDCENYHELSKKSFKASNSMQEVFENAEYVIIAVSTDYKDSIQGLDTQNVEKTIWHAMKYNPSSKIIIKSTVPIGFTDRVRQVFKNNNIVYCPEFLRQASFIHDVYYPSRIIVGDMSNIGHNIYKLFASVIDKNVPVLYTSAMEAESIKLFSNAYLALRVAYFNEIDTFSSFKGLRKDVLINGICLDRRIGNYYNNPSFGYSGYCLPKDTKQLIKQFPSEMQSIFNAIVNANKKRINFIVNEILSFGFEKVGIYVSNTDTDLSKDEVMMGIISMLKTNRIKCDVFISQKYSKQVDYNNKLKKFKKECPLIIANRVSDELLDVKEKIYTKEIYSMSKYIS